MSEHGPERPESPDPGPNPVTGERDVTDEQLPEDLRPTDDNPLAQPPDQPPDQPPEDDEGPGRQADGET